MSSAIPRLTLALASAVALAGGAHAAAANLAASAGITAVGYQPENGRTIVWRGGARSLRRVRVLRKAVLAVVAPHGGSIAFLRPTGNGYDLFLTGSSDGFEQRLAHVPGLIPPTAPAFSPDSQRLAFGTARGIELDRIVPGTARRVLPLPPAWKRSTFAALAFSPDGRRLAFSRTSGNGRANTLRNELDVIGVDGSSPRRLAANSNPYGAQLHAAWSPDGLQVAYSDGAGALRLVSAQGRAGALRLTTPPRKGGVDAEPLWSPDGETLAFTRSVPRGTSDVFTVRADGTRLRRLTVTPIPPAGEPHTGSSALAWSPGGTSIFAFRHDRFAIVDVGAATSTPLLRVGGQYVPSGARWN